MIESPPAATNATTRRSGLWWKVVESPGQTL